MIKRFNFLFITLLGLGKIKKFPGTLGSLVTVIILYILFHVLNVSSDFILLGLILIFVYSFPAIESYIKNNENKDPGEIIIDELIGQSIPIVAYEISHGTKKAPDEALIFYCICFVLFRFFDILKPFPISYFDQKMKNGFGIVIDDCIAGIFAAAGATLITILLV